MNTPGFVERYNAVQVPVIEHTIDDATGPSPEITDDFFQRIITSLELSKRAIGAFLDIKQRMLVPPMGVPEDTVRASDDFLTELWISGHQPLATALRTRTENNYQLILFNKYPLLAGTIDTIEQIHSTEQK